MSKTVTPTEDACGASPSKDESGRFALDALLRKHGYEIHERKKNQEAVWYHRRSKMLFTQSRALLQIEQARVRDAELMENFYWEQYV